MRKLCPNFAKKDSHFFGPPGALPKFPFFSSLDTLMVSWWLSRTAMQGFLPDTFLFFCHLVLLLNLCSRLPAACENSQLFFVYVVRSRKHKNVCCECDRFLLPLDALQWLATTYKRVVSEASVALLWLSRGYCRKRRWSGQSIGALCFHVKWSCWLGSAIFSVDWHLKIRCFAFCVDIYWRPNP